MGDQRTIDALLESPEPSIRWRTRVEVLREDPESKRNRALRREVRRSPAVRALLAHPDASQGLAGGRGVYDKWQGAHWVLASLADLGYPPGDADRRPLCDKVVAWWQGPRWDLEFVATTKAGAYRQEGIPKIDGRYRCCASQQGNALRTAHRLGLADERVDRLVDLLLRWQWPDGGWNCDRNPSATHSSFMETLYPMLGLAAHAKATGNRSARAAADRAREVFLSHRLFLRRSDGLPIHREFVMLHYPRYWHYDLLGGLKAMVDVGSIVDPRCREALDALEAKRLPTGGWPCEGRYYRVRTDRYGAGADFVDWGPNGRRSMNPWVTLDALGVLAAAGRSFR